MNNKVSIITPSYNSSRFIEQTINSVLAQTYENWEMIIVDDKSTDNSIFLIEKYIEKDSRIKLIKHEKNFGPAIARNKAIYEAEGRYIAFLDSDDIWLSQKLEKQIKFMNTFSLSATYSSYYAIDESGFIINTRIVPTKISYKDMLKSNYIGNLTGIYDVSKIGKFYMENVGHEDYTLWLKVIKKLTSTKGLLEPLAEYRILSNSLSSNKFRTLKWTWNIYRKIEKLNIFFTIYYFIYYVFNAIKKRR